MIKSTTIHTAPPINCPAIMPTKSGLYAKYPVVPENLKITYFSIQPRKTENHAQPITQLSLTGKPI